MPRRNWSRWKELNRHRSIIDRVLWPLSYTATVVDPTGLKPAPHGLKGRCSVTRAPGQQIGCGGRIRTFDNRINNPVPYQLGYATVRLGWWMCAKAKPFSICHLPFFIRHLKRIA